MFLSSFAKLDRTFCFILSVSWLIISSCIPQNTTEKIIFDIYLFSLSKEWDVGEFIACHLSHLLTSCLFCTN